jgi:hypothetical protein
MRVFRFSFENRTTEPGRPALRLGAAFFPAAREKMVGVRGVEPRTLRLSSACSNQLSYTPVPSAEFGMWSAEFNSAFRTGKVGGAEEIRTPDL